MIRNDVECRITREWIERFSDDLRRLDTCPPSDLSPRMLKAIRDGLLSQIDVLQTQVVAFESGIPASPRQLAPEVLAQAAQIRRELEDRFGTELDGGWRGLIAQ